MQRLLGGCGIDPRETFGLAYEGGEEITLLEKLDKKAKPTKKEENPDKGFAL